MTRLDLAALRRAAEQLARECATLLAGDATHRSAWIDITATIERALTETAAAARAEGYAAGVEDAAKVAEQKAREHADLATTFTRNKQWNAVRAHEQYALVCSGGDGVAARIRALAQGSSER